MADLAAPRGPRDNGQRATRKYVPSPRGCADATRASMEEGHPREEDIPNSRWDEVASAAMTSPVSSCPIRIFPHPPSSYLRIYRLSGDG